MEENNINPPFPKLFKQFFDFEFTLQCWALIETKFKWQHIDYDLWIAIYAIMQKYDEKNEKMKRRKAMFDEKQKNYCIEKQAREQRKKALWLHIEKAEQKLSEYKNVILAFGKLASTSAITK